MVEDGGTPPDGRVSVPPGDGAVELTLGGRDETPTKIARYTHSTRTIHSSSSLSESTSGIAPSTSPIIIGHTSRDMSPFAFFSDYSPSVSRPSAARATSMAGDLMMKKGHLNQDPVATGATFTPVAYPPQTITTGANALSMSPMAERAPSSSSAASSRASPRSRSSRVKENQDNKRRKAISLKIIEKIETMQDNAALKRPGANSRMGMSRLEKALVTMDLVSRNHNQKEARAHPRSVDEILEED